MHDGFSLEKDERGGTNMIEFEITMSLNYPGNKLPERYDMLLIKRLQNS